MPFNQVIHYFKSIFQNTPEIATDTASNLNQDTSQEVENDCVMIHGKICKKEAIKEEAENCRSMSWTLKKWTRQPALVRKTDGKIHFYYGQDYDPDVWRHDENGWTHDQCSICEWTLQESDNPEINEGYFSKHQWICKECHEKFVLDKSHL